MERETGPNYPTAGPRQSLPAECSTPIALRSCGRAQSRISSGRETDCGQGFQVDCRLTEIDRRVGCGKRVGPEQASAGVCAFTNSPEPMTVSTEYKINCTRHARFRVLNISRAQGRGSNNTFGPQLFGTSARFHHPPPSAWNKAAVSA
jgi:hypothetical protein